MKLYSWIENEQHIGKTQGGRKTLNITLDYEEDGQDWRCNQESHKLQVNVFFAQDSDKHPTVLIWGNKNINIHDKR